MFFGRTNAKAKTPILCPFHAKSWLIGKDSDAGRDWGQEEKGTTEDEMAGWHHRLDGHESEWTPGVGDGQGGLACCDSWDRKESDTTERLKWTELNWMGSHNSCYTRGDFKMLTTGSSILSVLQTFSPVVLQCCSINTSQRPLKRHKTKRWASSPSNIYISPGATQRNSTFLPKKCTKDIFKESFWS